MCSKWIFVYKAFAVCVYWSVIIKYISDCESWKNKFGNYKHKAFNTEQLEYGRCSTMLE